MIRSIPALVRRPVVWLGLPAILLVILYAHAFPSTDFTKGNWAAVAGQATLFLLFSAGLAAVGGALEGSRVRRALLFAQPVARPRLLVLLRLLLPAFLLGGLVQISAFAMLARSAIGSPGSPPILLLIAQAAAILFHLAVGFTLGRVLPIAAALPGALLASYSWLGFTGAVSYTPLRYLSGLAAAQCCSVDTVLNPTGPAATIVFSICGAAVLIAFGLRYPRRSNRVRFLRLAGTVTALVTIAAGSMWIARDVGYAPIEVRSPSEAHCSGIRPTVCLFPEQAADLTTRPTIVRAVRNLAAAGVPIPTRVTGARDVTNTLTASAYFAPTMTTAQVVHSLVSSYFPPAGPRYCRDGADINDRFRLEGAMGAWLIAKASTGIVRPEFVPPIEEDGQLIGQAVLDKSRRAQISWFMDARAAQASCSIDVKQVLTQ